LHHAAHRPARRPGAGRERLGAPGRSLRGWRGGRQGGRRAQLQVRLRQRRLAPREQRTGAERMTTMLPPRTERSAPAADTRDPIVPAPVASPTRERLLSLDAFRGLTVAGM